LHNVGGSSACFLRDRTTNNEQYWVKSCMFAGSALEVAVSI
jgi:hypothetical protein